MRVREIIRKESLYGKNLQVVNKMLSFFTLYFYFKYLLCLSPQKLKLFKMCAYLINGNIHDFCLYRVESTNIGVNLTFFIHSIYNPILFCQKMHILEKKKASCRKLGGEWRMISQELVGRRESAIIRKDYLYCNS